MKKDRIYQSQADLQECLGTWLGTSVGKALLSEERECLAGLLPNLFGYYLLQLGISELAPALHNASRFRANLLLDMPCRTTAGVAAIQADPVRLPVATDAIDAVIMPHTLDFSSEPHQVLREVERVLIPEGRLIIVGFNPWSLWGLWRLPRLYQQRAPWCGRFLAPRRVQDWLSLLGFEVECTRFLMFRPPLGQHGIMNRLEFLEQLGRCYWPRLGGIYLIQAVKRVSTLTPVRPVWQSRARLLGGRIAEPTTRNTDG